MEAAQIGEEEAKTAESESAVIFPEIGFQGQNLVRIHHWS